SSTSAAGAASTALYAYPSSASCAALVSIQACRYPPLPPIGSSANTASIAAATRACTSASDRPADVRTCTVISTATSTSVALLTVAAVQSGVAQRATASSTAVNAPPLTGPDAPATYNVTVPSVLSPSDAALVGSVVPVSVLFSATNS